MCYACVTGEINVPHVLHLGNFSVLSIISIGPSVSIVSLWLYCHRFGVNSHSVAVITTSYPVAIAMAILVISMYLWVVVSFIPRPHLYWSGYENKLSHVALADECKMQGLK